jgi:RNA polymerase sigma-70 factor (ECF subfamily)
METYRTLTDQALLPLVLARDEQAWTELVRRYRGLIYRCITKVTAKYGRRISQDDVNEIFADVCVNLLVDDMRKLRAYDPARGSKLGTWLGLLAIHTAYDHLRVTCRRPSTDPLNEGTCESVDGSMSPEDQVLRRERFSILSAMLGAFTERDRHFVELYFARGMAPEAIAHAMNISVKTVYSKKNKICTRLEALSQEQQVGDITAPEPLPTPTRRAPDPAPLRLAA